MEAYRAITLHPQPAVVSQFLDAIGANQEKKSISFGLKAAACASVIRRAPDILPAILKKSNDCSSKELKHSVEEDPLLSDAGVILSVRRFVKHALSDQVSSKMQEFLVRQLDNEDIVVRHSAANVLEALWNLSPTSLQVLGDLLKVVDWTIRRSLIGCFKHQATLPKNATRALLDGLKSQPDECAEQAASVLGHARLPRETIVEVLKMLSYEPSRDYALQIVWRQWEESPIPSDILHEGLEYSDSDPSTRPMFPWQTVMSLEVLHALSNIAEDGNAECYIRYRAIRTIEDQLKSQPRVFDAMLTCIKDKDTIISGIAATVLCSHPNLPNRGVDALVNYLYESRDDNMTSLAIQALCQHGKLPTSALDALVRFLQENRDFSTMQYVVKNLIKYPNLPSGTFDMLLSFLHESYDVSTRKLAIEFLRKQKSILSFTAVDGLLRCLDDKDLRLTAAATLWERSNAFSGALEVLLEYMDPRNGWRSSTACALGQNPRLPSKALNALVSCLNNLKNNNWYNEEEAIGALKNQSTLPADIIHKISLHFSIHNIKKSRKVLALLQNRDEFYHWLPNIYWQHFRAFYQASLRLSFKQTFILMIKDESLIVQLSDTQKVIQIPSIRDRLKLRAYFALAKFLVLHGERKEISWLMEYVQTQGRLIFDMVFPVIFAMLLAYFWF